MKFKSASWVGGLVLLAFCRASDRLRSEQCREISCASSVLCRIRAFRALRHHSHQCQCYRTDHENDTPWDGQKVLPVLTHATVVCLPSARKNGLVLNIGSFSGIVPSPMLATYSGTKAFTETFSTALADEVQQHGIIVQCINPYFVVSGTPAARRQRPDSSPQVSKMSKIRKPSVMVPMPAAFVRASLNKIGLSGGARFVGRPSGSAPYWSHSLLEYLVGVLGWKQATVVYSHELHKSIRKRVDRKLAREAKAQ